MGSTANSILLLHRQTLATMLLKKRILDQIIDGKVTLAFRRWKRPTVKTGGTLKTMAGVLDIKTVDRVASSKISKREAIQAGYESRKELLDELNARTDGDVYRIAFSFRGADPRNQLRQRSKLTGQERTELKQHLKAMDSRSTRGQWTRTTFRLISNNPGTRAPELAESIGMETRKFKTNVRKLKELGLTESLKVGYRLSPRGAALLKRLPD